MYVSVLIEVHSSLLPTRADPMTVARNIRFRTCSIQRFTIFEDAMEKCDPADHISKKARRETAFENMLRSCDVQFDIHIYIVELDMATIFFRGSKSSETPR